MLRNRKFFNGAGQETIDVIAGFTKIRNYTKKSFNSKSE